MPPRTNARCAYLDDAFSVDTDFTTWNRLFKDLPSIPITWSPIVTVGALKDGIRHKNVGDKRYVSAFDLLRHLGVMRVQDANAQSVVNGLLQSFHASVIVHSTSCNLHEAIHTLENNAKLKESLSSPLDTNKLRYQFIPASWFIIFIHFVCKHYEDNNYEVEPQVYGWKRFTRDPGRKPNF
jgi:hypothetical protein